MFASKVEKKQSALLLKLRGLTKERHAEEAVLELMKFYGESEDGVQLCQHGLIDNMRHELEDIKEVLDVYDDIGLNRMKRLGLPIIQKE